MQISQTNISHRIEKGMWTIFKMRNVANSLTTSWIWWRQQDSKKLGRGNKRLEKKVALRRNSWRTMLQLIRLISRTVTRSRKKRGTQRFGSLTKKTCLQIVEQIQSNVHLHQLKTFPELWNTNYNKKPGLVGSWNSVSDKNETTNTWDRLGNDVLFCIIQTIPTVWDIFLKLNHTRADHF